MNLTSCGTLCRSGLIFSPLALGTMTFGTQRDNFSESIFHAYVDAGGKFIDTADMYAIDSRFERLLLRQRLRQRQRHRPHDSRWSRRYRAPEPDWRSRDRSPEPIKTSFIKTPPTHRNCQIESIATARAVRTQPPILTRLRLSR